MKNFKTAVVLVLCALLLTAPQAQSQKIPVIGGYAWVYSGEASDTAFYYGFASFRSLTHVPNRQQLIAGVQIARNPSRAPQGAILTLDERTGAVLRLDSVCPRVGNESIRSAWLNDSGTVLCYTCMNERPRLVEYPSMREIKDSVLTSRAWTEGRVSPTGRYMILYRYTGGDSFYWLSLYDRVTGELVDLQRLSRVYTGRGEDTFYAPQFSADDRLLVTRDRSGRGVTMWDVEGRREIGSIDNGSYYNYMLSHTGDKLLISSRVSAPTDSWSIAVVYDAWTLTQEWYRPIKNYLPYEVDHIGALSYDGTEVILAQAIQTDTGLRRGNYWYALPDTAPRGFLGIEYTHWLQPKTKGMGIMGGIYLPPIQCTWNAALSVATTPEEPKQPLYPNPTTGEVVVNVGECQRESWQLRLSDQAGTLLREGTALCDDSKVRTAFNALPAGQYYLHLREPVSGRSVQAIVSIQR